MPELPEVETMCRGIRPIIGSRVVLVERPQCRRRPIAISPRIDRLQRRIEGTFVAAVERVGKRVVIWFSQNELGNERTEAIVIEPRMTGLVLLADAPTPEHLRFRLHLAAERPLDLWFWDRRGLGTVSLLSASEFSEKFYGPRALLGPDALTVSPDVFRLRLCRSRRAIKVALLDQRAIAGVGNLYASEILHLARVHPETACDRISSQDWRRIHAAMREVLLEAIQYEGSTLSDGTYRNALNENGGYQNHHRVYNRAGRACLTCEQPITRIVQAQRSTFFCKQCQKRRFRNEEK